LNCVGLKTFSITLRKQQIIGKSYDGQNPKENTGSFLWFGRQLLSENNQLLCHF